MSSRPASSTYYPRVYLLLKRIGFSPYKALEVLMDAKRRDKHALDLIRACRSTEREKKKLAIT